MLKNIKEFVAQFKQANRDAKQMLRANAVLEQHGLTALLWLDDAQMDLDKLENNEMDLFSAVKVLRNKGFIIVDQTGNLTGRVCKLFASKDDIALERRAMFRLVANSENND